MRHITISFAVLFIVCLFVAPVNAAFQWFETPGVGAVLEIKFQNFELVVDNDTGTEGAAPNSAGDELRGIFKVANIVDANTATVYWQPNLATDEGLVGYFANYISKAGLAPAGGPVQWEDGLLKVFYDDGTGTEFDPDFALDDGGAIGHGEGYDGAVNANYTLWLDTIGVGGIVGDMTVHLDSETDIGTVPFTGSGTGYVEIIGGSQASSFGRDVFDPGGVLAGSQDLFLNSDFSAPTGGVANGWPVDSDDPLEGVYVPEPASISVWALLLVAVGLNAARRRRR